MVDKNINLLQMPQARVQQDSCSALFALTADFDPLGSHMILAGLAGFCAMPAVWISLFACLRLRFFTVRLPLGQQSSWVMSTRPQPLCTLAVQYSAH